MTFLHFDPIQSLCWSAVINGVMAVPIMVIMMLMACSKRIMGEFTVTGTLAGGGWIATGVMALAAAGLLILV
ncbi:divalent metal cation transporter [Burkholderia cenocepacia]|nr:divalent metal cation transporter [Burkholderia cenocepacia]